jgi:hypothetical protein
MFSLPSSSGFQDYLRRVPSAVELDEGTDTVHGENTVSTGYVFYSGFTYIINPN